MQRRLTGVVEDSLLGCLAQELEPDEAVTTLVDVANLRGGPDNVSVIVAKVESTSECAPCRASAKFDYGPFAVLISAFAFLAFAWALASGEREVLIGAAIICAASAAIAVTKPGPGSEPGERRVMGGPYGNGPYRCEPCLTTEQAAGELRDLVEQLEAVCRSDSTAEPALQHQQVVGMAPTFDWKPVEPMQAAAAEAMKSGDASESLRRYAAVLRELMQRLRDDDGTHRFRAATAAVGD